MSALRLGVLGASGRMGRAVVRLAKEAGFELVAAVAATDEGKDAGLLAGGEPLGVAVTSNSHVLADIHCDVVIDFSAPSAMRAAAEILAEHVPGRTAFVSGTTGLGPHDVAALESLAHKSPVLWEPNMSVGVLVLARLVAEAVRLLGPSYDIEIVETHHGQKVDAPSGTALRLVEAARSALGESTVVHGRSGRPGVRPAREIGVHAVRGGDVVGDHVVHLLGQGERIELTHRASGRDLFARGALRAASWIAGKDPGRYSLSDILTGAGRH